MAQATLARPDAPRRTPTGLSTIILVVVGALACLGMTIALRDPEVVPRVTVDNRGSIPVNVDVRASRDGDRLLLDTVPGRSVVSTLDVIDQGSKWIFGFSSAGKDGGTLTRTREQLAADHWRVIIPPAVAARIQARPFVPSYR